jgi:hypothetical protein
VVVVVSSLTTFSQKVKVPVADDGIVTDCYSESVCALP